MVDCFLIDINKAFERLFDLKKEEIIGKSIKDFFPNLDKNILDVFKEVSLTRRSASFNFYSKELDKYFIVNVFSPKKYYFGILFQEVKELKELNLQLVIRNINHLIISSKNREDFFKNVCDEIIKIEGIVFAWIGLKREEGFLVEPISFSGLLSDYLKSIKVRWDDSELGSGLTGKAIKNRKIYLINDISKDTSFDPLREKALSYGIKSIASFPIICDDLVFGALTIHSNKINFFEKEIVEMLKEITSEIGIGISRFIDKERLMNKTNELEQMINNMLSSFSKIIAIKEPYTGDHSLRVSELAQQIGKELNLSEDRLKALKYASYLHDLGKIFIPSEILNKSGKLTEQEFSLIKDHVLKSYEIIKDIKLPYPTDEIVKQHHERLDGSGYPKGLKDGDILLEAKILAVADVVDAMTSNRPYRSKLSLEDIIEELTKNKGIKYDERVVDTTLKILKKLNST